MTRDQQDRSWACLPKEARDFIKSDTATAWQLAYARIFGHHNLISDTEPEEMLITPIKRAQQLYENYKNLITPTTGAVDKAAYGGVLLALQELFGDKCLPDKELHEDNFAKSATPNTPKSGELKSQVVEGQPKFKIGELAMNYGKKCRILEYNHDRKFPYFIHILYNNLKTEVSESDLESYTEPETKDNMDEKELNRKALYDALCELETASIKVRKALIAM